MAGVVNSTLVSEARSNQVRAASRRGPARACAWPRRPTARSPARVTTPSTAPGWRRDRLGHRRRARPPAWRSAAARGAIVPPARSGRSWPCYQCARPASRRRAVCAAAPVTRCRMIRPTLSSSALPALLAAPARPGRHRPFAAFLADVRADASPAGSARPPWTAPSPGCGRTPRCSSWTATSRRRRRAGSATAPPGVGRARRGRPAGDAGERRRACSGSAAATASIPA